MTTPVDEEAAEAEITRLERETEGLGPRGRRPEAHRSGRGPLLERHCVRSGIFR